MLLVAGAKLRYILLITTLSVTTVFAAFFSGFVDEYQSQRLRALFDPSSVSADQLYQADDALRAIGTGGVWGKGWLQGPMTNQGDIPVMWADFPFAAVGEQFGSSGSSSCSAWCRSSCCASGASPTSRGDMLGTYVCAACSR